MKIKHGKDDRFTSGSCIQLQSRDKSTEPDVPYSQTVQLVGKQCCRHKT